MRTEISDWFRVRHRTPVGSNSNDRNRGTADHHHEVENGGRSEFT